MEKPESGLAVSSADTSKGFGGWMFLRAAELGIGCAILSVAACVVIRIQHGGTVDDGLLGIAFLAGSAGYALLQGLLLLIATFQPDHLRQISDLRQVLAVAAVCLLLGSIIGCSDAMHKAAALPASQPVAANSR